VLNLLIFDIKEIENVVFYHFKMHIQGMTCTGCEKHIDKALKKYRSRKY